jgi:hypothetical protein
MSNYHEGIHMSRITLKNLVLYAALALSPAILSAQGTTDNLTSPAPGSDQATKPTDDTATKSLDIQSKSMAYQQELAACDSKPADQDACRTAVDQKYTNESSTVAPGRIF